MKALKTIMLLLLVFAASSFGNNPNGTDDERLIDLSGTGIRPHLIDPIATYCISTRMLSIEFPSADFEPYTLTVETMLTTQEYYVTTPFVSQYISPDVVNVDLYLETDGGDLYWGSFEATSTGSME
jgi:hypothetical protein